MITGTVKAQIDQIWNAFWSGGISNPLEVIEQITYLLFLRRLDDLHTLEENKSARLRKPLDYENTAKDLLQIVKTKKTELLFLALPDGVLFASSTAHKALRRMEEEIQRGMKELEGMLG